MNAAENPFRLQRTGALPFVGAQWPELWANLDAQNGRGAIVGPHGSGKTTLLGEVAQQLEARGMRVTRLFFNDRNRALPPDFDANSFEANDALLVDGPEHLRAWERWQLRRARSGAFVVTAHRKLWLPTWIQTSTSPDLLRELCARLDAEIMADDAARLWARHQGDVRAALWELYDRAARTQ